MKHEEDVIHEKLPVNIKPAERIVSVLGGAYLVYNALTKRNSTSVIKALAGAYLIFRGSSGYCAGYQLMGKKAMPDPVRNINIVTKMYIDKPRHEVYAFWRRLENLPLFMKHLESVTVIDNNESEWKARIPGDIPVTWKAAIVKDEPGEFLGWSSLPESQLENAGKVEFRDAGSGTELHVVITYRPPGGPIGAGIAKLFNKKFEKMVRKDIKAFKKYMETGIIDVDLEMSTAEIPKMKV